MNSNFKPRNPFSFQAYKFDLGTFMSLWRNHDDNHFLMKINRMQEKEYSNFYIYRLNYALVNELASGEDFFRHVW
jgi:hypothetical protein